MPRKYANPIDRIMANSIISETHAFGGSRCWVWIGKVKRNRTGMAYGCITRRISKGPRKGQVESVLAHRWVVKFVKGLRLSRRQVVMHRCNNSLCVNPEHLLGGTQKQNVRQCIADGRHRNGSSE